MNYFNYFTEIEDAFVRRRGKHLLLSPLDWALIESWKEMDVPLHVALRGIEKAFDSWEAKPRKRTVKSLLYCQEEVEAQYAEWVEAHVGSDNGTNGDESQSSEGSFSREDILAHLQRARVDLIDAASRRKQTGEDSLTEALDRAVTHLDAIRDDFDSSQGLNTQKLETSLTGLERMLSESIMLVVPAETFDEFKSDVKKQLKPYRSHMEKSVYEQTFNNLLMKRLRERYSIPRLSLFYL